MQSGIKNTLYRFGAWRDRGQSILYKLSKLPRPVHSNLTCSPRRTSQDLARWSSEMQKYIQQINFLQIILFLDPLPSKESKKDLSTMTQQDKRSSDNSCTKLFEDYKKWYYSLEEEDCASENSDSPGTPSSSQTSRPTEDDHVLPPAVKPGSRRDRRVKFDLTGARKSAEPTQSIQKNQAHSISPQWVAYHLLYTNAL